MATRPIEIDDGLRGQPSGTFVPACYLGLPHASGVCAGASRRPQWPQVAVVYTEGEDERVLPLRSRPMTTALPSRSWWAVPTSSESAYPEIRACTPCHRRCGFEVIDPENDPRFRNYWETYHQCMARDGISPDAAKIAVRRNTIIGALALKLSDADAMICVA